MRGRVGEASLARLRAAVTSGTGLVIVIGTPGAAAAIAPALQRRLPDAVLISRGQIGAHAEAPSEQVTARGRRRFAELAARRKLVIWCLSTRRRTSRALLFEITRCHGIEAVALIVRPPLPLALAWNRAATPSAAPRAVERIHRSIGRLDAAELLAEGFARVVVLEVTDAPTTD